MKLLNCGLQVHLYILRGEPGSPLKRYRWASLRWSGPKKASTTRMDDYTPLSPGGTLRLTRACKAWDNPEVGVGVKNGSRCSGGGCGEEKLKECHEHSS